MKIVSLDKELSHQIIAELINTIDQFKPESLVYCTEEPLPALEALKDNTRDIFHVKAIEELDKLPRCELGVMFDFLERREKAVGTELLCRLRNLKCTKLWVAVATNPDWSFNTMIGLGFKRVNCYKNGSTELCTYTYDIASYNRKREWNNPKNWANPENWGKYRW